MNAKTKSARRQRIRYNVRKNVSGTSAKPRLSVFRSNTDIYAQIIDDTKGATIAAASTKDKDIKRHRREYMSLQQRIRNPTAPTRV